MNSAMNICASLAEPTPEAMLACAKAAAKAGADIIEVRFDSLPLPLDLGRLFAAIRKETGLPILATCRALSQKGKFAGSEDEREACLLQAINAGAAFVDVELESDERLRKAVYAAAREAGCKVVVSTHDFKGTPPDYQLEASLESIFAESPDVAKIVTTAHSKEDGVRVLALIAQARKLGLPLVAFAMGENGTSTRIGTLLVGAPWSYACQGEQTAPGQMSVAKMSVLLEELGVRENRFLNKIRVK